VAVRRPFGELELCDQLGREPHTVVHIGSMNRSFAGDNALKALGLTRSVKGAVRVFSVLLNHLVRSRQDVRRNGQADLFGCFEIDHELELGRLLDRQVGRLGSPENFVNVPSSSVTIMVSVGAVRD
jgi:hypothetical protein